MSRPEDPDNTQLVGGMDGQITVTCPRFLMSREEAMLQAAWLVELAEEQEGDFEVYRQAVRTGKWPTTGPLSPTRWASFTSPYARLLRWQLRMWRSR